MFLAYVVVAVFTTWPLAAHLASHLPDGSDTLLHYWNGWWVGEALGSGQSPFFTPYLFFPAGISMVYHNFAWLHILPWLVLRPLIGGIAAYNVTFLAHLTLCGGAAYLLVSDLIGDMRVAFLAGLTYQCWPYRMSQPSHPNLMSTECIPIFMLFLVRAVRRGRWQDGLLAGLSLALVGYTRWQLLILAAIVGGLYLTLTLPSALSRNQVRSLLLAGAVCTMALIPPALLLAREWGRNPADLVLESEEATMRTDLLAYLTPASVHPVLGRFTDAVYQRYYADRGSRYTLSPYIGVTVLLLALLGFWKSRPRDSVPWIGMALVLILLALGPVLYINGRPYPKVPMPYKLVSNVSAVRLLREPERFNMALALPVAVLAAHGAKYLVSRGMFHQKRGFLLFASLTSVVLWEYLPVPLPVQPAQVSPFYARLAEEPGDFAVLDIPVDPYSSKPYMFAQVTHRRPIPLGHSSRYPKGAFSYLESQPWLGTMRRHSLVPPRQTDIGRQLNTLANDNIRYLIVHKDLLGSDRWAKWERYLAIAPRFEDDDIAVYATAPAVGRDFRLAPEVVPGIGMIRTTLSSECVNPGLTLELGVAWGVAVPPGRDLDVRVALALPGGNERQVSVFHMVEGWPAHEWVSGAVAWGHYTLNLSPGLAPGAYDIAVGLVDTKTGVPEGQPVLTGVVNLSSVPCTFPVAPGALAVNSLFGGKMRLLGYRSHQDEDGLHLTLYWRSERWMSVDYKVFVHVFDPVTSLPVAQDDAMPLQWTYPTTLWDPGEKVTDVISISLKRAPSGTYGVAVGVYDPGTGERLEVVNADGTSQPEGRQILWGETVRVQKPR